MMDLLGFAANFLSGGIAGGLLRLAPEVLRMFQSKADRQHELDMRKLDIEAAAKLADQTARQMDSQLQGQLSLADIQAIVAATQAQAQPTGIRWVDALNASVRPIITYWWMTLLTVHKVVAICLAWNTSKSLEEFNTRIWTPSDGAILGTIIGFWFVDRTIRHGHKVS